MEYSNWDILSFTFSLKIIFIGGQALGELPLRKNSRVNK